MGGTVLSVRDAKVSITSGLGSAGRAGTQATEGAVWKEVDSTRSSVVEAPWGLACAQMGAPPPHSDTKQASWRSSIQAESQTTGRSQSIEGGKKC